MAVRIFDLRDVPDEEADGVRELLARNQVQYYETRPSPFGFSAGAIWLPDPADRERALQLIANFQVQRLQTAREESATAVKQGHVLTFGAALRARPGATLLIFLAIIAVLVISAWPFLWFVQ